MIFGVKRTKWREHGWEDDLNTIEILDNKHRYYMGIVDIPDKLTPRIITALMEVERIIKEGKK